MLSSARNATVKNMATADSDISKLREILHSTIVEVEIAMDTGTHPDWSEAKENLLRAIEIVRRLERDNLWSALSKKKK
ncbi:MAG TPA: hypothetical protein VKF81_00350 [Blastocatellia bacterium]|nr:hypothetical protein [Blastocatellia bacterium]